MFLLDDNAVASASVRPAADASDLRAELQRVIEALDADQREAFLLKHVEQLSYDEMAAATGVGVSALKMRVKRACDRMQWLLRGGERCRNLTIRGGWTRIAMSCDVTCLCAPAWRSRLLDDVARAPGQAATDEVNERFDDRDRTRARDRRVGPSRLSPLMGVAAAALFVALGAAVTYRGDVASSEHESRWRRGPGQRPRPGDVTSAVAASA